MIFRRTERDHRVGPGRRGGLIQTYARIILPISISGFVVTLIWQFTSVWNDFLFALFLTQQNNGPVTLVGR